MTAPISEAFVPLPNAPARPADAQAFKVLISDHPEKAHPFRPAEAAALQAQAPAADAPKPKCEPRVSLVRDGDKVTAIHIQCSCGQIIDLACVYPPEG